MSKCSQKFKSCMNGCGVENKSKQAEAKAKASDKDKPGRKSH
jgi:hypothetical protein